MLNRLINLIRDLELDNYASIVNINKDASILLKNLKEPRCLVSRCTEKDSSALSSKLEHNNLSNMPRLLLRSATSNCACKSIFVC